MTKEELEKEAGDYADEHAFRVPYDGSNKFYDDVDFKASKEGYLAGAKPREKRIEELEQENNKLLDVINNQDVKIADLEETIANLKEQVQSQVEATIELDKENAELKRIVKMVAMINKGIYTPEGIKAIYEEAEQFLKEKKNEVS